MNNLDAILDLGSQSLRLGVFDQDSKNIYISKQKNINDFNNTSFEKSLKILIRDAEKKLSSHIENVVILYDSPKFYSLDISIKKTFDDNASIKEVYNNLIQEAHFFVSQNNYKDQIIHLVINHIIVDEFTELEKVIEDIKIKSLKLEIKFICLKKKILDNISNAFKKNNLKILKLYCSSYVKTIYFKDKIKKKDSVFFIDIGFERTSIIAFDKSKLKSFKTIPLGGNNITKDISKVLKLNLDYSEDLKVKLNEDEKFGSFNKEIQNEINPYSEMLEKNISIKLLKNVIKARIDEIIELAIYKNNYFEEIKSHNKPNLILLGGGSKLLANDNNLDLKKKFSELIFFDESDCTICESGQIYNQSDESDIAPVKKNIKKEGFFERFFNLFAK